jgi:4-carboxymuconolactone decarboxylase
MDDEQRYVNGMATRREVLGEAYVDRAESAKTDFTAEFQAFITRYAWGDVWQRPGLDRRTRSFITLSMLLALDRADEFMLHVRGALNNGLSRDEIKEVLLHGAIYCGVPVANRGYKLAQQVFRDLDAGG